MTKEFDTGREFEFRVWHREQEYMYDNVAVSSGDTVGYESTRSRFNCETSKNIVVLQYTGRKDKDGEKVFEGDILKVRGVSEPAAVRWDDEKVGFVLGEKVDWPSSANSLEVLGNIFEDPELLESESS